MTKRLFSVLIDADVANACEPLVKNRKFSETVTTLLRNQLLSPTPNTTLLVNEQIVRNKEEYLKLMQKNSFALKLKEYPEQKDYWVRACGFKSIADLDEWHKAVTVCSTK